MPELPEVTVISEDVEALAAGRKVLRAGVFRPDVTNVEPEEFERRLVGKKLRGTGRRGKITLLDFGDVVGVVHLVISGRVLRGLDGVREGGGGSRTVHGPRPSLHLQRPDAARGRQRTGHALPHGPRDRGHDAALLDDRDG